MHARTHTHTHTARTTDSTTSSVLIATQKHSRTRDKNRLNIFTTYSAVNMKHYNTASDTHTQYTKARSMR